MTRKNHVVKSSMEEVLNTTKEHGKETSTIDVASHMIVMGNRESEGINEFQSSAQGQSSPKRWRPRIQRKHHSWREKRHVTIKMEALIGVRND